MTKDSYPALFHYIHKAMYDISYPAKKSEILSLAGARAINTGWDTSIPFKLLLDPIRQESFSCAADFYCALLASFR
jgi:hypothetical protein